MTNHSMNRRAFMKRTGAAGAALAASTAMPAFAAGQPVESMSVLTANASFDPVRPEMGRLITQAAKGIGWDIKLAAEDYNIGHRRRCSRNRILTCSSSGGLAGPTVSILKPSSTDAAPQGR